MILTPVDTLKTTLQVQGARGTTVLRQRIKSNGVGSLWWGAFATAAATFVGHVRFIPMLTCYLFQWEPRAWELSQQQSPDEGVLAEQLSWRFYQITVLIRCQYPWFATYNFLSENIAEPPKHPLIVWLLRLAFIGFVASIVSDSVSNSLRVVKTYRQVNDTKVSYGEGALLCSWWFILNLRSRGCEIGGPRGRINRALWSWAQDTYLVQWASGLAILNFMEALPRPVS